MAENNLIIKEFTGDNFYLSNFYEVPVTVDGVKYANNEAAFHAYKCPDRRGEFTILSPKDAKRLGRSVQLRADWEAIKFDIMERIVRAKFTQHEDLKQKLLATGDAILEEGNTWNDKCWGIDIHTGEGENHLGKILMKVRDELRAEG